MKIPKPFKVAGVITGIGLGGLFTTNYYFYHNVSWDTGGVVHLRKTDGIIAHSELEIYYQQQPFFVLHLYDPFGDGYRRYSDSNADGNLESFRMTLPFTLDEGIFDTKTHAKTHKDLLEREKQRYQQELREFTEKYPQEFKQFGLEELLPQ